MLKKKMVPRVEKENLPLTGRNLEQNRGEERRQILRTISQQLSDDISALQNLVVPSPTEQELFVSLIWCLPGSSRADEDNVTAPNTEHQYSGGQPPPQIPSKFIHLCFPKWAHPHISDHNKALQSEDFFAPFFARSDAFMRGTVVYPMTSRQRVVADWSPIWCPWFRNSCSILFLSDPSPWHRELHRNLACRGTVHHKPPKTFVIVENWNQLCKRPRRQCSSSLSVSSETSHRWDPGESVDLLSSRPGLLLHAETVKVENREQHRPLLLVQPPAEV